MNKFYLVSILSLALGFTACSDDDDSSSDDSSSDDGCVTCTTSIAGTDINNVVCEDADGVVTIDGVVAEGFTYETAIATYTVGGTCE